MLHVKLKTSESESSLFLPDDLTFFRDLALVVVTAERIFPDEIILRAVSIFITSLHASGAVDLVDPKHQSRAELLPALLKKRNSFQKLLESS
jgi:hypothetical protein